MENKKNFNWLEKLVRKSFGQEYKLEVFYQGDDVFADEAQIFLKVPFSKIYTKVQFSSFLQLRQQIEEFGKEQTWKAVKEYLEDKALVLNLDPLLLPAVKLCIEKNDCSTTLVQREFGIGYPRAARIVDQMIELGFASGECPRKMLVSSEEFAKKFSDVSWPELSQQKKGAALRHTTFDARRDEKSAQNQNFIEICKI